MDNLFESVTDDELLMYLNQYREWKKFGFISDYSELAMMRDKYFETYETLWQIKMTMDLLSVAANKWEATRNK